MNICKYGNKWKYSENFIIKLYFFKVVNNCLVWLFFRDGGRRTWQISTWLLTLINNISYIYFLYLCSGFGYAPFHLFYISACTVGIML